MIERFEAIASSDGPVPTFVAHPERGGPFPVVLFLMDAAGMREEIRDMARRLATSGYYVLAPNIYHRQGVGDIADGWTYDEISARLQATSMDMVMRDCDALLAYAAQDSAAGKGKVGAVGYCFTGQHAVNAAARHQDKIAAAASFHGVSLVTENVDSPHLMMQKAPQAEFYFAGAELDQYGTVSMMRELEKTAKEKGVNAEIEIFLGADHGYVFPSRAVYHKHAAETHWERLLALFARRLR
ncbi:MAG: dienelactone hydrolase family protein [Caulobacterales bacterium]